ncbi:MAG: hypothetical protein ACLGHX_06185, partial [Acidimicrobiia bacterium]
LGTILGVMAVAYAGFVVVLIFAHGVTQAAKRMYQAPGRALRWVRRRGPRAVIDRVVVATAAVTLLWVFGAMARFTRDGFGYWTAAVIGSLVAITFLFVGLGGFARQFPGVARHLPGMRRRPRLVGAGVLVGVLAVAWNFGTGRVLEEHSASHLFAAGMWASFVLVHLYLGAWLWLVTLLIRFAGESSSPVVAEGTAKGGTPRSWPRARPPSLFEWESKGDRHE